MDFFSEKRILTVSQATSLIRGVLEENFEHIWIEGEVSNCATPSSGHVYFTLKDAGAQLRCVVFRGTARMLRFRVADGMGLIVRGRITVYDQRGEYQLLADYLEPQGIGALQTAFLQLKERLAAEGLFSDARKRAIPVLPRTVGVVTSTAGAALHDILTVAGRRFSNLHFLVRPVRVQGEGAAAEIAAAIGDLNRCGGVDVVIVARGGGSIEDLWAFNEEAVARAIARSRLPVISAVGHETDYTIADFVADLRAPTPSAAAELVVKSRAEIETEIRGLVERLHHGVTQSLLSLRGEVRRLGGMLKHPGVVLGFLGQRLDDLEGRLSRAARRKVEIQGNRASELVRRLALSSPSLAIQRTREKLVSLEGELLREVSSVIGRKQGESAVAAARLQELSPLSTLERGFAVVTRSPGRVTVRRSAELHPGDSLRITFAEGRAVCTVEETEP